MTALVVSDSDIRVAPDYLRRTIARLAKEEVGVVTCLSPWPRRKAQIVGISTDFITSVAGAARSLEGGVRFALGSAMAFRRSDLAAIGGTGVLFVNYLADEL